MNAMRYTIVIIWQKDCIEKKLSQTIFEKKNEITQSVCWKRQTKCTIRMAIQIGRGKVNAKKKIDFFVVLFSLISLPKSMGCVHITSK